MLEFKSKNGFSTSTSGFINAAPPRPWSHARPIVINIIYIYPIHIKILVASFPPNADDLKKDLNSNLISWSTAAR